MPMWLIFFICIILVCVLLLFFPLPIRCVFSTEETVQMRVTLQIFCWQVMLFSMPKRSKLPKLSKFSIKALKKRGEILKKKRQKKYNKAQSTQKKQQKKMQRKKEGPEEKVTFASSLRKTRRLLKLLRMLIMILFRRFEKHLTVHLRFLDICIGSPDPATTAVLYGSIYAALDAVWTAIGNTYPMRHVQKGDISLTADFCRDIPSVRGDITFMLRVWHLFLILIEGGAAALRHQLDGRKQETVEERRLRTAGEAKARADVLKDLKS